MNLSHHKQANCRRIHRLAASWCTIFLIASLPAHAIAEGAAASEFAVKAAIIFKIAKFVSWPEQAFADHSEPLTLCLQETDPLATAISALDGRLIHGRVFSAKYLTGGPGLNSDDNPITSGHCQILLLTNTGSDRQSALLDAAAGLPILTIGDSNQFIGRGGIIGLEIEQNRVRFAINTAASESAGLDISAQLLQLAKIMDNRGGI